MRWHQKQCRPEHRVRSIRRRRRLGRTLPLSTSIVVTSGMLRTDASIPETARVTTAPPAEPSAVMERPWLGIQGEDPRESGVSLARILRDRVGGEASTASSGRTAYWERNDASFGEVAGLKPIAWILGRSGSVRRPSKATRSAMNSHPKRIAHWKAACSERRPPSSETRCSGSKTGGLFDDEFASPSPPRISQRGVEACISYERSPADAAAASFFQGKRRPPLVAAAPQGQSRSSLHWFNLPTASESAGSSGSTSMCTTLTFGDLMAPSAAGPEIRRLASATIRACLRYISR